MFELFNNINYLTLFVILVFISQIVTLSIYLPLKWRNYRTTLFERHPREQYPYLYYQPESVELNRQTIRRVIDSIVIVIGVGLILEGIMQSISVDELAHRMFVFSIIQIMPFMLSRYWGKKNDQLMNERKIEKVMKASMSVRKITDFISPKMIMVAAGMYFISLVAGLLSSTEFNTIILMIILNTVINIYLTWSIFNGLYSERTDQYLSDQDRLKQIGKKLKRLILSSIIFSAFILSVLLFERFGLNDALIFMITSFFLQLIFIVEVNPKIERDFTVYQESVYQESVDKQNIFQEK